MAGLVQDIDGALSVPDFQFSLPHELQADFQLVEDTSNALASFKQTLLKLQRRYGGLDEHLAQLTQAQKNSAISAAMSNVSSDVRLANPPITKLLP